MQRIHTPRCHTCRNPGSETPGLGWQRRRQQVTRHGVGRGRQSKGTMFPRAGICRPAQEAQLVRRMKVEASGTTSTACADCRQDAKTSLQVPPNAGYHMRGATLGDFSDFFWNPSSLLLFCYFPLLAVQFKLGKYFFNFQSYPRLYRTRSLLECCLFDCVVFFPLLFDRKQQVLELVW
jgi:hypothetical protein